MSTIGAQIGAQGDVVKQLKQAKAPKKEIEAAVAKLLKLKADLAAASKGASAEKEAKQKFRAGCEDLLLRKFFYVPAFEIYGGVGGLYDFGPPGCSLKTNILEIWRRHFVLTENMLEVSCSALTPEDVLKTSGHVDKFTDFMVKDVGNGTPYRADKLLEDHIDELIETTAPTPEMRAELLAARTDADACSSEQLGKYLKKYGAKAPTTGNELSEPFPFNLMFETQIGPTGKARGYMRPETAQGIFVNFRRLLEFNGGRMPFAAAQIGLAFRNEISPRSGLLRVREFPMAEIEHFVNPEDKSHPKFKTVAGQALSLLPKANQTGEDLSVTMTAGEAVSSGTINNETLAYFIVRTWMFLTTCGVKAEKLRFRQHKDTEMAHYACDCWDAEILTTYGWIECVGHADRSAFDLTMHSKRTNTDLSAQEALEVPRIVKKTVVKVNQGVVGKTFKKAAKALRDHLATVSEEQAAALKAELAQGGATVTTADGAEYALTPAMVSVETVETKESVKKYLPAVIEPSFGIGRIMYSILEHAYTVKEKNGEQQGMLALPPMVAPVKCAILPMSGSPDFYDIINALEADFVELNLATKLDPSGSSPGRKYARADEIGVPFAVTVDFASIEQNDVTIRDRDSTTQIRVAVKAAAGIVHELCTGVATWEQARAKYPNFSA